MIADSMWSSLKCDSSTLMMIVPLRVTLNLSSDASSSKLYVTMDSGLPSNSIVKFEPVVID